MVDELHAPLARADQCLALAMVGNSYHQNAAVSSLPSMTLSFMWRWQWFWCLGSQSIIKESRKWITLPHLSRWCQINAWPVLQLMLSFGIHLTLGCIISNNQKETTTRIQMFVWEWREKERVRESERERASLQDQLLVPHLLIFLPLFYFLPLYDKKKKGLEGRFLHFGGLVDDPHLSAAPLLSAGGEGIGGNRPSQK